MNRVAILIDISNLYFYAGKRFENSRLDYKRYLDNAIGLFSEPISLFKVCAYGFQRDNEAERFKDVLRSIGFTPKYKQTTDKERNWNVGLSLDVVNLEDKIDTLVLGSSSGNLVPLVSWCQNRGIKVIVLACSINRELKDISDSWVEIDKSYLIENGETNAEATAT